MTAPRSEKMKPKPRQGRIPATLQSVFLASNRGKEVHRPPPEKVASRDFFRVHRSPQEKVASRDFFRNWFFQGRLSSKVKTITNGASKKKVVIHTNAVVGASKKGKQQRDVPKSVSKKFKIDPNKTPQAFLEEMLEDRGYSTQRYKTLETAYYNIPSDLQLASHDVFLVQLIRDGNEESFREIMASGVSPNPCNSYGESLLHTVCRRGDVAMFQVMADNGTEVRVADDYGRTPLHDACWCPRPCFDIVEKILKKDIHLLLMTDCRGALPLTYVRREFWGDWIDWLNARRDQFWPIRDDRGLVTKDDCPPLAKLQVNSLPILDPPNALSPELAKMVCSGRMKPSEARMLAEDKADDPTADESASGSDSDDDESDDDDDDDGSDFSESDCSIDEDEILEIFNSMASIAPIAATS